MKQTQKSNDDDDDDDDNNNNNNKFCLKNIIANCIATYYNLSHGPE
jgi:hypothetical protein